MAQQASGSSPMRTPSDGSAISADGRTGVTNRETGSSWASASSTVPVPPAYRAVLYSSFHDCIKCLSEFACSGAIAAAAAPPSASSGVLHGGHGLQQDVAMEAIRHVRLCASFIAKYPQVCISPTYSYTVACTNWCNLLQLTLLCP